MLARTPLYSAQLKMAAKMVDFGGWEMPLHYGSQIAEHHSVRGQCAMFDVSHMTIVDIHGERARQYLQYLLANDVSMLSAARQAIYCVMLNDQGGVIDDLIAYEIEDGFRLVVNCATRAKDIAWLELQAPPFGVTIIERADMAMIAVQGPQAIAKVRTLVSEKIARLLAELPRFGAVVVDEWHYARTGYTGEDGLEIMLPAKDTEDFWWQLHKAGVVPAGLGARDTLRLEAGLNLYSHEMDEQTSPLVANLAWTIAWRPEHRDFIGRKALVEQRQQGLTEKLVGVSMTARGVMRAEQTLRFPNLEGEGIITSGSFSPTLGYSIALARVPVDAGDVGEVAIRNKFLPVRIHEPNFLKMSR